jgi:flagellar basal-body rod protein FlgB
MLTGALFGLADRHAQWLNVRQRTIAENVAHSNTPAYVSKTVSDFAALSDRFQVSLAQTDNQHIAPRNSVSGNDVSIKISEEPGGNPVRLEDEMIAALDVRRSYELNTSIVKAFNRMILSAVKG